MKTQAWGWLTAAVLAAGLNATYHDGGLEFAHRIAGHIGHNAAAVLALASGHADQFLMEARQIAVHNDTRSCPFSSALARVEGKFDESEAQLDRAEAVSAREQAHLARLEANRVRIQAELAAKASRLQLAMVDFHPADFSAIGASACPRVRVRIPRIAMTNRDIHVDVNVPTF